MIMEEAIMRALASVNQEDVLHDYRPFLVIYKDGRVHKFLGTLTVPPSVDSVTGVESKDVTISTETGEYVRLYKPQGVKPEEKVPLLVYFHGGGFVVESASSPLYHMHMNALASKANVVIVSVNYRTAPEHPIPAAYHDSWAALEWVKKGLAGAGDEPWLKEHADGARVFLAGDSAGANIAHHMAKRLGKSTTNPSDKIALKGLVLVHPYFWGEERIGTEHLKMGAGGGSMAGPLWKLVYPGTCGSDDPLINPALDPELGQLAGEKIMVCVAEQDALRDRGLHYKEALLKSGWKGAAEFIETKDENHVFHLLNPASPKSAELMDQFVAFLNSS